jgi:hypothetical protein
MAAAGLLLGEAGTLAALLTVTWIGGGTVPDYPAGELAAPKGCA